MKKIPIHDVNALDCSLDADGRDARLREWNAVLDRAAARYTTDAGKQVAEFAFDSGLEAELRRLVDAEGVCCPDLELHVERAGDRLRLIATSP